MFFPKTGSGNVDVAKLVFGEACVLPNMMSSSSSVANLLPIWFLEKRTFFQKPVWQQLGNRSIKRNHFCNRTHLPKHQFGNLNVRRPRFWKNMRFSKNQFGNISVARNHVWKTYGVPKHSAVQYSKVQYSAGQYCTVLCCTVLYCTEPPHLSKSL